MPPNGPAKFIHAADLHVDSPLLGLDAYEGAPVERIRNATRRALENLVQLAIDEQVRFVVLAGDVYDTQPLFETSVFFRRQMQALADEGIPVAIVLGNHDHAGVSPPGSQLPGNVHVLSHQAAESLRICDGVVVHGRSFPRPDYTDDLVKDYPAAVDGLLNVGLLHTSLAGDPEHNPYAPTSTQALGAMGYQYWALGHVHRHASWVERGAHIVFPGNLQGRHIKETGPKGAVVVEYEGARVLGWRHVPLDVMRWHHVEVDATNAGSDEALVSEAKQALFAQTAADREQGLLCAARISLKSGREWRASRTLRERLIQESQEAGELLWLEKVRMQVVERRDASELTNRLVELATRLVADPAARQALDEEVEKTRVELRKVDPALLERSELLAAAQTAEEGHAAELFNRGLAHIARALGRG